MIPASYLFVNTYRQHWEQPEPTPRLPKGPSFFSGLMTPITGALEAVLSPHAPKARHHLGGHAYE